MMRIIAGSVGGRRIAVPPKVTRPTTDRVREAIFGKLDASDALRGARVLDAFAGSGALGIEALSRGAAEAVFVESVAAAAKVIAENLRSLGLEDQGSIAREKVLAYFRREGSLFTLALLDPPYDIAATELTATLKALAPRLAPGARVVLELSRRSPAPEWPAGITPETIKKYGETSVHYAVVDASPSGTLEP